MRPLELLEREITALASQIHAATCRWLELVAEYDAREGWAHWGCKSCAHWVSWQCGIVPGAAREHVRVARRLQELPLIRAAFGAGELSFSKVRALTRVENVEREAELLEIARHATASQLERLLRAYRSVVAAEQAATGRPERWLVIEHDDDGSVLVRGRFPAEEGALIVAALEAAQEHLATLDRPGPEPGRDVSAETPREADKPGGVSAETLARGEAGRTLPRERDRRPRREGPIPRDALRVSRGDVSAETPRGRGGKGRFRGDAAGTRRGTFPRERFGSRRVRLARMRWWRLRTRSLPAGTGRARAATGIRCWCMSTSPPCRVTTRPGAVSSATARPSRPRPRGGLRATRRSCGCSSVTAGRSRSGGRRAASRRRCGERSTRATAAAASPAAARAGSSMPITSSTGRVAARPISTTWSSSAAGTTGCCTRAASASSAARAAGWPSAARTAGASPTAPPQPVDAPRRCSATRRPDACVPLSYDRLDLELAVDAVLTFAPPATGEPPGI